LSGPHAARLIQLDARLSKLYSIRRTLAAGDIPPVVPERRRSVDTLPRRWFIAGAAVVVAWTLLTLGAWVAPGEFTVTASPAADVVRATR
jgi:hypothetical protein